MKSWFSVCAVFVGSVFVLSIAPGCDAPKSGLDEAAAPTVTSQVVTKAPTPSPQELAVRTSPGATCALHAQGHAPLRQASLFADGEGLVRFYLDSVAAQATETKGFLALDCNAPDGTALPTQLVDPAAATALDQASAAALASTAPVRPALEGNPDVPSQAELLARGFPARPDRIASPDAYTNWRAMASNPARRISAGQVPHPGVYNGLTTDQLSNWSGPAIQNPGTLYQMALGSWNVPTIGTDVGATTVMWVGLDGQPTNPGSGDVCQAGTKMHVELDQDGDVQYYSWSYSSWLEWYPSSEVGVSLSTHPGDNIYYQVFLGDSNGTYDFNGSYCWAFFQNVTTNQWMMTSVPRPSNTTFTGHSAEWIVERPKVCTWAFGWTCAFTRLANYGAVAMNSSSAYDTNWAVHYPWTDSGYLDLMYGNSGMLSSSLVLNGPPWFFWVAAN